MLHISLSLVSSIISSRLENSRASSMPSYVIEHMESDEADGSFPPWVSLEYFQMIKVCSPSPVIFSSLSPASVSSLRQLLVQKGANLNTCKLDTIPVQDLMAAEKICLNDVCLLDPKAEKELSPEDSAKFKWFLFGGILGDDPPRDRTGELRKIGFPTRHLGSIQMTTDTAVAVTRLCVEEQTPLSRIPFIDHPVIKFDDVESVEMPFRYVANEAGEPTLPEGMKDVLRDDMDKEFEF